MADGLADRLRAKQEAADNGDAAAKSDDGAPAAGGLADRMEKAKIREVTEADPAAVERALAEKASLAERMQSKDVAGGAPATSRSPSLADRMRGAAPAPAAPATLAQRLRSAQGIDAMVPQEGPKPTGNLSDRLRGLQQELEAARSADAVAEEERRRKAMDWFVGKEIQEEVVEGPVTPVPDFDATQWRQLDFYPVEEPFSFVRILENLETGEPLYEAHEPPLSEREEEILEFVTDALIRGLDTDPKQLEDDEKETYLLEGLRKIIKDYRVRLAPLEQRRVEYYVRRDFLGMGTIQVPMKDPHIEDISCDGAEEPMFIFHRQLESMPSNIRFKDDYELDSFVIRMAQRSGKAISISEPILDAALPDDSRLQATLGKEVTQNGSTFTIRRFRDDPFTPMDLMRFGSMDVDLMAWFWQVVQHGRSLIFSGGTASGKTTGLNAISQFIPYNVKLVSIEDTREVNLPHKNWIKAVTRVGSAMEGSGEIGMFALLKAALRQRPEYILVGEVRGIEATVAFQAMATGHTVYATMHADSARSVVYRLENEPINVPRLVLQALDVIAIQAQVRVNGKRVRRVTEVVELVGLDPTTKELLTHTVFKWDPATDKFVYSGQSYMLDSIAADRNWNGREQRQEFENRKIILNWMLGQGLRSVTELITVVKAYYRDPEAVLTLARADLGLPPPTVPAETSEAGANAEAEEE